MRHSRLIATACVALGVAAGEARADLAGAEFAATYRFPDLGTVYPFANAVPPTFTVGAGIDTTVDVEGVTFIDVDFTATTLTLVLNTVLTSPTWNATAFNGLVFDATLAHGILSATVTGATTMSGFDNSRVTLTADEIRINWNGLSYVDGTVVAIQFAFGETAVPEPASLALLGLGLFGLAAARRRRV